MERFLEGAAGRDAQPLMIMRDRDAKISKVFTETQNSRGLRTNVFHLAEITLADSLPLV